MGSTSLVTLFFVGVVRAGHACMCLFWRHCRTFSRSSYLQTNWTLQIRVSKTTSDFLTFHSDRHFIIQGSVSIILRLWHWHCHNISHPSCYNGDTWHQSFARVWVCPSTCQHHSISRSLICSFNLPVSIEVVCPPCFHRWISHRNRSVSTFLIVIQMSCQFVVSLHFNYRPPANLRLLLNTTILSLLPSYSNQVRMILQPYTCTRLKNIHTQMFECTTSRAEPSQHSRSKSNS